MSDGIWVPRKESPVLDVSPHPTRTYTTPDGRRFIDSEITLTPEAAEKLWQGYACARCLEGLWERPLPEAYPKECPTCRFPIRELQRKLLEQDFVGEDPMAQAGFPLDRELAYLEEQTHKSKGLMTVPKKLKK